MTIKKLLFVPISCLFAVVMVAQQAETGDTKATTILQALSKKTKTYKTIYAEVTLTKYGSDKKADAPQKATIWLKGGKYKYDSKNQTAFCDSAITWTYLKDANEVQINKVDASSDKGNLSLATIFGFYEKGFKSRFIDEEKANNILCECVDLYPKHPEKENYHTLRLYIDKTKNQIVQATGMLKDGSTINVVIDKFTPNVTLDDVTFTFDAKKYPGVEIEDLRE